MVVEPPPVDVTLAQRLSDLVPGFPSGATTEFDLTHAGPLDFAQRAAVRRVAIGSFGADPLAAASSTTLGDLAATCLALRPGPILSGDRGPTVRIRPFATADVEALYLASVAPESSFAWRFRGATPSRTEFVESLTAGVLCQFAVDDVATGSLVGLVTAYEPWFDAGHVKVGFLRCYDGRRAAADGTFEGLVLLLGYVFRTWPVKKVFLEIPEFNDWIAGSMLATVADLEGDLRGYLHQADRLWSMRIYALTRSAFATAIGGWMDEPFE